MGMNLRDPLGGFFWLAISIFVCIEAIWVGLGTFKSPGPGFLPFWAGVVLGSFSILLIITSVLKKKGGEKLREMWKGMAWKKVLLVLFSLFLYILLLPRMGYIPTTFGLMIFMSGVIRRSKLWTEVMIPLITVLASYFIFNTWLGIQLPKGIFGF
jgi:putative tricarboxylic transport membrane protein